MNFFVGPTVYTSLELLASASRSELSYSLIWIVLLINAKLSFADHLASQVLLRLPLPMMTASAAPHVTIFICGEYRTLPSRKKNHQPASFLGMAEGPT
jgi:hypothetical protein